MWRQLPCRPFSLSRTLFCGQVFRWVATGPDRYTGVIGSSVVELRQQQGQGPVQWKLVLGRGRQGGVEEAVHSYFQVETDANELQAAWMACDAGSSELLRLWKGVMEGEEEEGSCYLRVLRQDPYECLVSFLCSQNNHVSRISAMIDRLCRRYGTRLGKDPQGREWHSFPAPEKLLKAGLEEELTGLGFGYRAKYVAATAQALVSGGMLEVLQALRDPDVDPATVARVLSSLPGVGRKVADCVALFSLDKPGVVPVDTHVHRIARAALTGTDGFPSAKTLTPQVHNAVQAAFTNAFGPYAGWAHSMMFHAELTVADGSVRGAEHEEKQKKKKRKKAEEEPQKKTGKKRK